MSETETITVVHDELPHPAVVVEGHTVTCGEPAELPAELAERLLADDVGWRRADGSAAAAADEPAGSPYAGMPLDQLRGLLAERSIEHEGRLTIAIATELLTAYDTAAADTSATD